MNVGSYGATEPHLWLMSQIPTRTWDDCRTPSERKSRTHTYDDLVDLLIELALERDNDSHMENFLKKHLGRGGTPTPERGEGKGPKNPTNANQGGGIGVAVCFLGTRLVLLCLFVSQNLKTQIDKPRRIFRWGTTT